MNEAASRNPVYLTRLHQLLPHEDVDPNLMAKLEKEIVSEGVLRKAITVDENSNIILNGIHRYAVLKRLGCRVIPVVYVDYASPEIMVESWREGMRLSKKDVLEAGLSGEKLPPKTSRHLIKKGKRLLHISVIERRVDVPLNLLKSDIELVDLESIRPAMQARLEDTLASYSRFLKTGNVDTLLIVDGDTNVLLCGVEAYSALELLSAKKTPVLKVDLNAVEIEAAYPHVKIDREAVVRAGINGPKLPPNSFRVKLEPFKVKFPLKDLISHEGRFKNALKVFENTVELLVDNWPTPMVKLKSLSSERRTVWAKLECYNPFSNSVKDRVGWFMLAEAAKHGELKKALYEATSTNTGIALASIANTLGIKSKLFMPEAVQKASDIYLDVLGAEVVRLPVGLTVEAVDKVDAEAKAHDAMHLNQFENDANFKVHLKYTAREIDEQLGSLGLKPTCIIGGLGTSGHMSAISFYFKAKYGDDVKVIGVQPALNEIIPGIRRVETGMKWLHMVHFDEIIDVTQLEAIEGAVKIARSEGLLIGLSAGAVVSAFQKTAEDKGVYVLVFPDSGYKYAEQFEKYFSGKL